ncbi:MAG: hypothetical protein KF809_12955 [Chloroflexi bacterium]|nr:hypothetical protein [Chloroflexota bacterium]
MTIVDADLSPSGRLLLLLSDGERSWILGGSSDQLHRNELPTGYMARWYEDGVIVCGGPIEGGDTIMLDDGFREQARLALDTPTEVVAFDHDLLAAYSAYGSRATPEVTRWSPRTGTSWTYDDLPVDSQDECIAALSRVDARRVCLVVEDSGSLVVMEVASGSFSMHALPRLLVGLGGIGTLDGGGWMSRVVPEEVWSWVDQDRVMRTSLAPVPADALVRPSSGGLLVAWRDLTYWVIRIDGHP